MQIVKGKVEVVNDNKHASTWHDSNYDRLPQTRRMTRVVLDNGLVALFQNHSLDLKRGDKVIAGGFRLGKWFMIMSIKNTSSNESWTNNAVLHMLLGLFIVSLPFWVGGESPLSYSANLWLFLVLPFVLVGAAYFYFGYSIFQTAKRVSSYTD